MSKERATVKPNNGTRRPKGISPTIEIPPDGDDYVPVAVDSLEARIGYSSLLRQLQESYLVRVAFFRSKEGGALSLDEAHARASQPCEDEEEAKRLYDDLRRNPVDQIRFVDLASMWRISPAFSESLWEMIKTEARDEFESGLARRSL